MVEMMFEMVSPHFLIVVGQAESHDFLVELEINLALADSKLELENIGQAHAMKSDAGLHDLNFVAGFSYFQHRLRFVQDLVAPRICVGLPKKRSAH